ncbi:MafI family immunity protein [uncultured Gilliamella sp.]|uniref:MafI family immunity protein n=1 Tax=uncultured Gilliamella sp. TaxID=1193505 RepID=UPI0025CEC4C1|nr:MafI family immunity protein [uncultured Gilliamella sp.]
MLVNNCIKEFGNSLKDRIDPELIDYALDYINHFENVLAFETLCDHIADFDVKISGDEYKKVLHIIDLLDLDLNNRFLYINPNK